MNQPIAVARFAWLQKHASPLSERGDFHWYAEDPEQAASLARAALAEAPAHPYSVVELGESSLVWIRSFSATSAAEQRKYTGATMVSVQAPPGTTWRESVPRILAALPACDARPWSEGQSAAPFPLFESHESVIADKHAARCAARAALFGGELASPQPHSVSLPKQLAAVFDLLGTPELPHRSVFIQGNPPGQESPGRKNLVHYVGRLALGQEAKEARARVWNLVRELSASEGKSLEELFSDFSELVSSWEKATDLSGYLQRSGALLHNEIAGANGLAPAPLIRAELADAGHLWNRVLNYWGRGFLGMSPQTTLRLANTLAKRITCDHLFALDQPEELDGLRYWRRVRTEALLPRGRREEMLRAVSEFLPSLGAS